MLNRIKKAVVLILIPAALFVQSCKKTTDSVGSEILPDNLSISFVDTFTIDAKTIIEDSIVTGPSINVAFLGNYLDPELGQVSATTYMQFSMQGNNLEFGDADSLILDSLMLELDVYDVFGNYESEQTLEVYECGEILSTGETYYSNSTSTALSTEFSSLAKVKLSETSENIRIRLSDDLGNRLLKAPIDSLLTNEVFHQYFKGFVIKTQKNSPQGTSRETGGIYFVKLDGSTTNLSLYYRKKNGSTPDTLQYDFVYNSSSASFYNITRSDTTNTLYDDAQKSAKPKHAFMQSGTGFSLLLDFPYLKDIKNVGVNKAELILNLDQDFLGNTGLYPPPGGVFVLGYDPETGQANESELQSIGYYDSETYSYTINLTSFVRSVVAGQLDSRLVIRPELRAITMNRAVMATQNNPNFQPKLKVIYSSPVN